MQGRLLRKEDTTRNDSDERPLLEVLERPATSAPKEIRSRLPHGVMMIRR